MVWNKKQVLEELKNHEDTTIFSLKAIKETRSQMQNRLYWKWLWDIVWVFEERWEIFPVEHLHEFLRDTLIKWKYKRNVFTGKRKLHRKSTTELNKKEFSKYIQDVERYLWQQFEVSHPLPTDIDYNL